jgi:hypothetical protein
MTESVRQIIREDRRRTIDEVSMLVGISHGTCHKILREDLKMRRVISKFVPRLLSVDQKQQQLDVCLDLKENAANDPTYDKHRPTPLHVTGHHYSDSYYSPLLGNATTNCYNPAPMFPTFKFVSPSMSGSHHAFLYLGSNKQAHLCKLQSSKTFA